MTYDPENIFARILRKDIPCKPVAEDEFFLAFHDIHPRAKVHVLVIPKGEYKDFHDFVEKADASVQYGFYRGVARIIRELGLEKQGYRLVSNTGGYGGQEVPHYHVHILGGQSLGPMVHTIS